jgi:hypothetical protein
MKNRKRAMGIVGLALALLALVYSRHFIFSEKANSIVNAAGARTTLIVWRKQDAKLSFISLPPDVRINHASSEEHSAGINCKASCKLSVVGSKVLCFAVDPRGRARGDRLWFLNPRLYASVGSVKQFFRSFFNCRSIPQLNRPDLNDSVLVLDISNRFSDVLERDGRADYLVRVVRGGVIKLEVLDGKIGALVQLHRAHGLVEGIERSLSQCLTGSGLHNGLLGDDFRLLGLGFHLINQFSGIVCLSLGGDDSSSVSADLLNARGRLFFSGYSQIMRIVAADYYFNEGYSSNESQDYGKNRYPYCSGCGSLRRLISGIAFFLSAFGL